ncbi:hypothetical protein JIG36_02065 [Actinoplanes sp. LDG1-06]|uniref:Integral membrane protein n=1 Tax=Paractinoplanes ovalisporus TaxID=2810368 RepID=A0ABS2A3B3_9ACTN|nr:hypothetical protein [Actinoplanes ovalisporus]MBM2614341.1 hypothetical protein [Actinoplanes ovalisporus]
MTGEGVAEYRSSPRRLVAVAVVVGVTAGLAAWLILAVVFSAVTGRVIVTPLTPGIVYTVSYTFFYTVFSLVRARRRPTTLTFGPDGIEMAAAGCDAVMIPYDIVARTRLRGRWPLTVLQVFVADEHAQLVTAIDRSGRRPPRRNRNGRLRFDLPLAGLNASGATIRAELNRTAQARTSDDVAAAGPSLSA